ncbi:uncharacterized protein LOC113316101 [Papaver somniferum]|nr:uncharacterized protein LOC113316101 [Papaver somniferum]
MNTMNFLQCSSSSAISHLYHHQHFTKPISLSPPIFALSPRNSNPTSSYFYQNNKKNSKKKTKPEKNLIMIVDIEEIKERARLSIHRFFNKTERKINNFVSSGNEAVEDLKTLVTIDYDNRVIISCKRSSIEFFGTLLVWGFLIFVGFRVLMDLELLGFGRGGGFKSSNLFKRDRSLAGKEVVVGKRKKKRENFKFSVNPLTPAKDTMRMKNADEGYIPMVKRSYGEKKLPKWWPEVKASSMGVSVSSIAESQKEAETVMRAIMDNRMSGKDISEDDIIQFRRTCKNSGAKVLIETTNARDSFYRASVELVLNSCSRSTYDSAAILIDGESPQNFVAGMAFNLGLDTVRAARIVSASVASRTRSWFLQAWALEMQGKHSEAVEEISKICLIHQIFPPEEFSPEMEMVARGLEKHLRREQREFLLDLFVGKCDAGSRRSAAEALGLVKPVEY